MSETSGVGGRLFGRAGAASVLLHAACAALLVWNWSVCAPGILNGDNLWVYTQALTRGADDEQARWRGYQGYDDWFPPFVSVALTPILSSGWAGLRTITFAQNLLGWLGVYLLAHAALRLAFRGWLTGASARHLALATLVVLFLPWSPLKFYLVQLGHDTWELLCLIWVGVVWLRLIDRLPELTAGQVCRRVALATAAEGAALLCRHNAVAMLPAFILLTWLALWRHGWKRAGAFTLALLLLKPGADAVMYRACHIMAWHPEDQVMALDLVGVLVEDESLRPQFPYTSSHLIGDRFRTGYEYGNVLPLTAWVAPERRIAADGLFRGNHDAVVREYRRAWRLRPNALAVVKLKAFLAHLLHPAPIWYDDGIVENRLGLRPDPKWAGARGLLLQAHQSVYADPVLRQFGARHLPWLLVNAGWLLALAGAYRLTRDVRFAAVAALLLAPLLYYLSHLLAVAHPSYRYMYPATLAVQVFTLALGLGFLAVQVKRAARAIQAPRTALTGGEA